MTKGEASAKRLCLCCGTPGAVLLRTRAGRAIRMCTDCSVRCEGCRALTDEAVEREAIGRESEWMASD
jgi:hypothetical protein